MRPKRGRLRQVTLASSPKQAHHFSVASARKEVGHRVRERIPILLPPAERARVAVLWARWGAVGLTPPSNCSARTGAHLHEPTNVAPMSAGKSRLRSERGCNRFAVRRDHGHGSGRFRAEHSPAHGQWRQRCKADVLLTPRLQRVPKAAARVTKTAAAATLAASNQRRTEACSRLPVRAAAEPVRHEASSRAAAEVR